MTKRVSKAPEVRKKELIDIASKLFEQYGYEKVSVRDILSEVNGAPGMFYYYFKSKEDIYLACMEEFFSEKLEKKVEVLQDKKIPYAERVKTLRKIIAKDIAGFAKKYHLSFSQSITDNSYRLWELNHYIGKFVEPYADFILEGIESNKIKNKMGITKESARHFAAFILYGASGVVYSDTRNESKESKDPADVYKIIGEIFY